MRVRVEWYEHRRMSADIEVESVAEVRREWAEEYDSELVDEIEGEGAEIDGGIDWDSMEVYVATRTDNGVRWVLDEVKEAIT